MARNVGTVRLVVWCGLLAGLVVLLRPDGSVGPLSAASDDPAELLRVLAAGGRWLAFGGAAYLAGGTVVTAAAEWLRWAWLRRLADRLVVPVVRRGVRASLGVSLAVGVTIGPVTPALAAPGPPGAGGSRVAEAWEVPTDPRPGRPVWDLPARSASPAAPAAPAAAPAVAPPRAAPASVSDGEHEVVSGESFWAIAAALVEADLGRPPTDAEVVPVWEALIDANRDRLVVPGDPDLLLPGQRLRVPTPEPSP